jgi:hypothetical protein
VMEDSLALRLGFGRTASGASAGGAPAAILLIVAGQSNANKNGTHGVSVPLKYASLSDAWIWNPSETAFEPYVCGGNSSDAGSHPTAWGSEAEFIHLLNGAFPGARTYVVKRAVSGTPLAATVGADWAPSTGELYGDITDRVAAARAWLAAEDVTLSHEVTAWAQGEADMTVPADAAAYGTNFAALLAGWRSDISSGLFVCERTRLPGHAPSTYASGYQVREAQHDGVNGDGNARLVDTDFLNDGFTDLHPGVSWAEGCGARLYAAWRGSYSASYGAIEDTAPASFAIADVTAADPSSLVTSSVVSVSGIERATVASLSGGQIRVLHPDDTIAVDWTGGPTAINKYQKFQVRQTASASFATETAITVTIGGVSDGWSVTTGTESPDYDDATQAILDRIADLESPALSGAHAAALDTFVRAAKDADFWDDIAVAYLLAMPSDRAAALINVRNPAGTLAAEAGSGSWSASAGYNPGAAAGNSIDLGFNPSAEPQNTVALCAWFSGISANASYDFRSTAGSGNLFGMYRRSNGDWRFNLNNANATRTGLTVDPGFYMAARTGSAAISFYGPAWTLIDTATTASGTPAANDLYLGHPTASPSNDAIAAALLFNVAIDATKAQAIRDALNSLGVAWGWTGAAP